MKTNLTILTLCLLLVSGCATGDIISLQNAREAEDTVTKYLDPTLPQSAKDAATLQAKTWREYEEAKFGK